jgi:hypothetical protein
MVFLRILLNNHSVKYSLVEQSLAILVGMLGARTQLLIDAGEEDILQACLHHI